MIGIMIVDYQRPGGLVLLTYIPYWDNSGGWLGAFTLGAYALYGVLMWLAKHLDRRSMASASVNPPRTIRTTRATHAREVKC